MKVVLRKNIKIDKGEVLPKGTEAILVGVSWGDRYSDEMFHILVKDKKYLVDKSSCQIQNTPV